MRCAERAGEVNSQEFRVQILYKPSLSIPRGWSSLAK
jgi:hypothetical protein